MNVKSVKFKNHYCFKESWSGFDGFRPINVIIGRNNSGKSRLLDLVSALCDGSARSKIWRLQICGALSAEGLKRSFRPESTGAGLNGDLWLHHGKKFVGIDATVEFEPKGGGATIKLQNAEALKDGAERHRAVEVANNRLFLLQDSVTKAALPLNGRKFRCLLAERDIQPEKEGKELRLGSDGHGATNFIRRYLRTSRSALSRDLVQKELLTALNEVFQPDGHFTEIEARQHDEPEHSDQSPEHWEIYLGENQKGLIALSTSGSGLKTVLLVLLNLLVVPDYEKTPQRDYVFAFEELENNLHPALLRRLFSYLERYVVEHNSTVFLTTHSSAALDVFGLSSNAQIIHVSHNGESATARTIAAHFDRAGIVSELGAKPSDLLQANGILWVEGPSDRIYLNRWIELVSDGKLREGRDNACACYGGSVLACAQFTAPENELSELNNLLRINPNIAVICDSDRTAETGDGAILKDRVERIRTEVEKIPNALIWITEAKEMENYLPAEVLAKVFENPTSPAPGKFDRFLPSNSEMSFVESHFQRKSVDKVKLAAMAAPHMTTDLMKTRFDWSDRVSSIVETIRRWNT